MAFMSSLYSVFGKSPIKPIQQHMRKVYSCVSKLDPFIEAVFVKDWSQADALQHKIVIMEHEADSLKKELRSHLPTGLFLPVNRIDIINILRSQDKIANITKDIAGLILGRKMLFPEAMHAGYKEYLNLSIATCKQASQAICELDELLETGFQGREVELVESIINQIDDMESNTDEQQIKLRLQLMKIEGTLPPIDVMFLYHILAVTGALADRAQKVGGLLQLLLAK